MALLLAPLRWLISSIIRLAILAAVLVAVYLLLVRPAIDSGKESVDRSLHSLEHKASPARLAHCVGRAGGDVGRLKRCARLY